MQVEYVPKMAVVVPDMTLVHTSKGKWSEDARGYCSREIVAPSVMHSYKVTVSSCKCTRVLVYAMTAPDTMHLAHDLTNAPLALHIHRDPVTFMLNFKSMMFVSDIKCVVCVKVSPVEYVDEYSAVPYTLVNSTTGHLIFQLPAGMATLYRIQRLIRPLVTNPRRVVYTGLRYCVSMNSLLTLSDGVEKDLRYPPYSVRVPQWQHAALIVKYRIRVKASEGDNAHIVVTLIETLSRSRYSVLKDSKGTEIKKSHTGSLLEGVVMIDTYPVDVGLHIYTPYGFSGDIGDDPDTDLATILEFGVECQ